MDHVSTQGFIRDNIFFNIGECRADYKEVKVWSQSHTLFDIKSVNNPLHLVFIRPQQPQDIDSMTAIKRVALIGASGKIGPSILEAFLVNGNFDVTVLSRKSSGATFPSGVKIIKTDVDYDSLRAAFSGQDAVVSIVGGAQASNQKLYIDAAIAAGVKRFIPSDFGGWTPDAAILDKNKLFKSKVEIAEYLKEKESETFSWSAIINGPVFDWVC